MNRRSFSQALLLAGATLGSHTAALRVLAANTGLGHYGMGDTISPEVFVVDRERERQSLVSLLNRDAETKVNMLFLFGGGDMGRGRPGGIWCQDSFNEMHILRTLVAAYKNEPVGIIPVACAPVYSTKFLNYPERVFLDAADDTPEFQDAAQAFIDSTQAAVDAGILPMQPWYDLRLRTLMSRVPEKLPSSSLGPVYAWQGSFRAITETQNYGVPSFWLLGSEGMVLTEPFRGNIYHPHGGPLQINYSLTDIDETIRRLLG